MNTLNEELAYYQAAHTPRAVALYGLKCIAVGTMATAIALQGALSLLAFLM